MVVHLLANLLYTTVLVKSVDILLGAGSKQIVKEVVALMRSVASTKGSRLVSVKESGGASGGRGPLTLVAKVGMTSQMKV